MNLEELYTMNPWWYDRGNIEEDRNLRLFSTKKVKFYPSFLRELADFEAGVYVLRGPRQVGGELGENLINISFLLFTL